MMRVPLYPDLNSAEIARAQGAPEGTVRWRLESGLDELRRQLDERYCGRQQEWRAALVPLLGARREAGAGSGVGAGSRPGAGAAARAGWLTVSAGLALLLAGGLWLTGRQVGTPRTMPEATTSAAPIDPSGGTGAPGGPGRPGRQSMLALGAGTAEDCGKQLTALRAQLAATEPEFIATARGEKLFELGQPNPVAEATLGSLLAALMKGDAGAAPDCTLECRTWACRLEILEPEGGNGNSWSQPLQRDPAMRERTRGIGFGSGLPVKDPVSGATFRTCPCTSSSPTERQAGAVRPIDAALEAGARTARSPRARDNRRMPGPACGCGAAAGGHEANDPPRHAPEPSLGAGAAEPDFDHGFQGHRSRDAGSGTRLVHDTWEGALYKFSAATGLGVTTNRVPVEFTRVLNGTD